ncbi:MAG: hypothetical protein ACJA1I_001899 [Zhongshania marina]|jgi:hypothetical protein
MQKSPIFGGEEFLREKFNFSTAWLAAVPASQLRIVKHFTS